MRSMHIVFLTLLLTTLVFPQANKEMFELKGQLGLTGKDESIIQPVSLDNGSKLLLIGKKELQFWDVSSGKLVGASSHKIKGFWAGGLGLLRRIMDFPIGMEVSPDGRKGILATKVPEGKAERERTAVVWDLQTGEQLAVLERAVGPVRSGSFSEDGSTIMTIHGELKEAELSFWNAADFTHRAAIKVQDLSFYELSGDGEHVFIGSAKANKWLDITLLGFESSKAIELRNTRTGKLEKTYSDGDIKFWNTFNAGPGVSPDEKYLAARNDANRIVVWETAGDGRPKYQIGDADARNTRTTARSKTTASIITRWVGWLRATRSMFLARTGGRYFCGIRNEFCPPKVKGRDWPAKYAKNAKKEKPDHETTRINTKKDQFLCIALKFFCKSFSFFRSIGKQRYLLTLLY